MTNLSSLMPTSEDVVDVRKLVDYVIAQYLSTYVHAHLLKQRISTATPLSKPTFTR
jgi:hypothetical protein